MSVQFFLYDERTNVMFDICLFFKEKVFYHTGGQKPFVKRPVITQQRIDEILDKINQKGFNHLSDEEKSILEKASEADF